MHSSMAVLRRLERAYVKRKFIPTFSPGLILQSKANNFFIAFFGKEIY